MENADNDGGADPAPSPCASGGPKKSNGNCSALGADGLPVQCVGEWAEHVKHVYLQRYIEATWGPRRGYLVPGEHGAPGGAAYVDLFSGPGRVRIRDTGEEHDGSPLVALRHDRAPFSKVVLCDLDKENVAALRARAAKFGNHTTVLRGDANAQIDEIVDLIPASGLNIAFIDPFGLSGLRFETLRKLATVKRMDLIIHFPTGTVKRNLHHFRNAGNRELDLALGTDQWRKDVVLPNQAHLTMDYLVRQLEGLGYTGMSNRSIQVTNRGNTEMYRLLFASKDGLGDKIWQSITQSSPSGQRGWDW